MEGVYPLNVSMEEEIITNRLIQHGLELNKPLFHTNYAMPSVKLTCFYYIVD
jgi:hypothetical protein